MPDFNSVLSKVAAQVEKPKPKPVGTYIASVVGLPTDKTVQVQGADRGILEFKLKMTSPHEGVDADQLAAVGEISSWPPFTYGIWYDTPEGEFQLTSFLTITLGIDDSGDKTIGELVAQSPGLQCLATLKHRPYQDKSTGEAMISTDIGGVAKL